MIELVSQSRCINCDKCVKVCPTNVFDAVPEGAPVIARKEDCQTCYLCEAYCPVDALYVAPEAHVEVVVNEAEIEAKGLFGVYRRHLGWAKGYTTVDRLNESKELNKKIKEYEEAKKAQDAGSNAHSN